MRSRSKSDGPLPLLISIFIQNQQYPHPIVYSHTFRNTIVTGSFTLPVMMLLTLVCWLLPDVSDWTLWLGLAINLLAAYLIMELNNRHTLLRVRSRLISTTFLTLMVACPALHAWHVNMLPVICYVASHFLLFASYQLPRPEGHIFHAFLFAGVASLIFPPMLVLVVGYWASMLFQLRNFTWHTFMASLFGLAVSYWFMAAYAIWQNHLDTAFLYLIDWFTPQLPDYSLLTLPQLITGGFLIFLATTALVHFFHTAYNDKIRTRMLYYVLATQEIILLCGMVLLPTHIDEQLLLFIVNSSAFIAHYYALARGRFFNLWFYFTILLIIAMAIFNYLCLYGPLSELQVMRPLEGITLW